MKIDSFKIGFVVMLFVTPCLQLLFPGWGAFKIMAVAQLIYIPCIIAALIEVNKSNRIDKKEKAKWTLAFIFITLFTSLYYLIAERKNVIPNQ
ncbi:MAG: hypothetical protein WKF35_03415 [Ferruginibacter sp.]